MYPFIYFPEIIVLFAGACLPLAFAPINFFLLALICPAILLIFLKNISGKRALLRGFLFGLGFFGVGVSWVFVSIHVYGNANVLIAGLFTLIFVVILALFPAVQAYLTVRFFPEGTIKNLIAFPCSWLLIEWIRSWIFTGFPWLLIAFSQLNSPLAGYIPVSGEYGTGFLLLFSSGLLVELSKYLRLKRLACFFISASVFAIIWIVGALLIPIHWTKPIGQPIKVALIQGNIPQDLKWLEKEIIPTIQLYYHLTTQHWDSPIIIWPEAAIPVPLPPAQEIINELDEQAKAHQVALLVGIPIQAKQDQFYFYNSMIALGTGKGRYHKRHLVPFGEYVPFEKITGSVMAFFNFPMSTMINGLAKQPNLIAAGIQVAPFICYEIAYDQDLLQALPQAKLLLTISNDAWFGDSLAPAQHLQIGQFRALQSGRELLFSANNGITAIVDFRGEIKKRLPQFQREVLTGTVQPMQGMTPWARVGNTPIVVILFLLFIGAMIFSYRRIHHGGTYD